MIYYSVQIVEEILKNFETFLKQYILLYCKFIYFYNISSL